MDGRRILARARGLDTGTEGVIMPQRCCTMRFTSVRIVAVDTASLHSFAPSAPQ